MTNDEFRKNDEDQMTNWSRVRPDHDSERWEMLFWGPESDSDNGSLHEDSSPKRVYDLEERTALFGEAVIRFCKKVPHDPVNNPLIDQLVRAGTSVGANYCEADDGVSKKDFKHRIGTCRKELARPNSSSA